MANRTSATSATCSMRERERRDGGSRSPRVLSGSESWCVYVQIRAGLRCCAKADGVEDRALGQHCHLPSSCPLYPGHVVSESVPLMQPRASDGHSLQLDCPPVPVRGAEAHSTTIAYCSLSLFSRSMLVLSGQKQNRKEK